MDNISSLSSGFVGKDIPEEENLYSDIKPFFSSENGYSCLYICRINGKLHIIKGLKERYRDNEFYRKLLRKEFEIGYTLEHTNICKILGWKNLPEIGVCILMEYIDGITLREFLKSKTLKRDELKRIITMICDALSYIHSKQIVHRDLKPENILITHNGNNVRLIDFGLSDSDDYDILKIPAGTKSYIAPELLNGEKSVDKRADIYSLGVILAEIGSKYNDRRLLKIARLCTKKDKNDRLDDAGKVITELNKSYIPVWIWIGLFVFVALFINIIVLLFINQSHNITDNIEKKSEAVNQNIADTKNDITVSLDSLSCKSKIQENKDNVISHLDKSLTNLKSKIDKASKNPVDANFQKVILGYVECLRAAYEDKNISFINQIFSEKALIITGTVMKSEGTVSGYLEQDKVEYNIRSKKEYIHNLMRVFKNNDVIRLSFSEPLISRHPTKNGFYGVTLKQGYRTLHYSDDGYLFLLWDFRNPEKPQIYVRTWQAAIQKDNIPLPDDMIFRLSDFNLE